MVLSALRSLRRRTKLDFLFSACEDVVDHDFGFVYLILFAACYIILTDATVIGHNRVMHLNFLVE